MYCISSIFFRVNLRQCVYSAPVSLRAFFSCLRIKGATYCRSILTSTQSRLRCWCELFHITGVCTVSLQKTLSGNSGPKATVPPFVTEIESFAREALYPTQKRTGTIFTFVYSGINGSMSAHICRETETHNRKKIDDFSRGLCMAENRYPKSDPPAAALAGARSLSPHAQSSNVYEYGLRCGFENKNFVGNSPVRGACDTSIARVFVLRPRSLCEGP